MATFEVRGCRKVVLDDEADLPHPVGQKKTEIAPSLLLLGAAVREYVHAWRLVFLPSGISRCTSVST